MNTNCPILFLLKLFFINIVSPVTKHLVLSSFLAWVKSSIIARECLSDLGTLLRSIFIVGSIRKLNTWPYSCSSTCCLRTSRDSSSDLGYWPRTSATAGIGSNSCQPWTPPAAVAQHAAISSIPCPGAVHPGPWQQQRGKQQLQSATSPASGNGRWTADWR